MRLDRLLAITVILLNRGKVQARELARHFEVTVRTIYRDLEAINLAGIPVISIPGNNGGYTIAEQYKIDRQVLSLQDMLAIGAALKGLNNTLENRELDSALDKIHSLIPAEQDAQLSRFHQQFVIDILPWGTSSRQKAFLKDIHYAVLSEELISITYRNYRGECCDRIVEPMTLLFKGFAWYLFGFCLYREDFRMFRLSRIASLKLLDRGFSRREASYQDYENFDMSVLPQVLLQLKFNPAARVKVEDFFEPEQIRYTDDGFLFVETSFPEDEWVYSFLLSYGPDVEIINPRHIRRIVSEKAKKIYSLYQT